MKKRMTTLAIFLSLFPGLVMAAGPGSSRAVNPDGTYLYAQKDGESLYLDVYNPTEGSCTRLDGRLDKPTVIFMFGGGFTTGCRDKESYLPWFGMLTSDGYRVVSIDYRLGLKGVTRMGVAQRDLLENAIEIAVEDLYSATAFLVENSEDLGIDPDNIVISGSSAGAISVLQAEWELCNGAPATSVLPEGFRYTGVMSFAGAVYSKSGRVDYAREPAPVLFFHGTKDKVVVYRQIQFFHTHFSGSQVLCRLFARKGWNYNFVRFNGRGHEVATSMVQNYKYEKEFLENNVMRGEKRIVNTLVDDPSIPTTKLKSTRQLYSGE